MDAIYGKDGVNRIIKSTGVGLGNFDGLHVGHMALINTLISESRLSGLDSVVYTFTKHSENIIRKRLFTPLLTTVEKKIELLGETRLNYMYFDEFDEVFSRMKPEDFIKKVLVDRLGMKLAVAGFDYSFGYRGEGDTNLLKALGRKFDFRVIIIPPIKINEEVVSSTLIRQNVSKGNMEKVFNLLGRHYSITGKVSSGRRIGNTLGFPTANIHPADYLILPSYGVYATKTCIDGKLLNSVTNVGINPTFEGLDKASIETHILDFDENLYDKFIEVFFIVKIRGEKKFQGRDELVAQITKDVAKTRQILGLKTQGKTDGNLYL